MKVRPVNKDSDYNFNEPILGLYKRKVSNYFYGLWIIYSILLTSRDISIPTC